MTRLFILALSPAMQVGLRVLLQEGDLLVVGEASEWSWVVDDPQEVGVFLVADAALLDEVEEGLPPDGSAAIVLLSDDPRAAALLHMLPLHGWSVLPPDAPAEMLHAAIAAVAEGLVVLPRALSAEIVSLPLDEVTPQEESLDPLTAREREVLDLLSYGLPNKLIARDLAISEHTVKFHLSSIFSKLGVSSRTEAVTQGARQGLVRL